MYESEFKRVLLIDRLLHHGSQEALTQVVNQEFPKNLLGTDVLNAARALRLPATVIFLATLAVENLAKPHSARRWLAVYQSVSHGAPNQTLQDLPNKHPLKAFGMAVAQGGAPDAATVQACRGDITDWADVVELCMDHSRFDLMDLATQALQQRRIDMRDWLSIGKTMLARHPHLQLTDDTGPMGRAFHRIYGQVDANNPGMQTVRSRLALCAAKAHAAAGEYAESIAMARLATAPQHQIMALFEMATGHCHLDQLDDSLRCLDHMIPLFCTDGFRAEVRELQLKDKQAVEDGSKKAFDPKQASVALVDLQHALETVGQKAFLVSGTLLGYAREGRILLHDKDIDVGIIGWEGQYDVIGALLESRRFALDARRLRGHKTYHIPIKHLATGVAIDIFIYHPENGKLVTGVESYYGYLQRFAFTPFELKAVKFLDIDFYVPSDVELNLAENFGDWRQPDPEYISHMQSPSTVDVGGKVFQIVGRIRALEAIRAGKPEKLRRAIQILAQHQHREGGISDESLDHLRSALQTSTPQLAEEVL